MSYLKRSVAVLTLALLVSGCGVVTYTKSLFVTGVSLEALGEQFAQVSTQVTAGCASQAIAQATCEKYAAFGKNFKRVYPLTVGLWTAANRAGDSASQQKAEDVARQLTVDLSRLAIEALGSFAPEVK